MIARISLAPEDAHRALPILEQEALALRPSPFQRLAYRLLNLDVAAFLVALAIAVLVKVTRAQESTLTRIPYSLVAITGLTMLALFVLNVPLVSKLWRVSNARRRLGIAKQLAAAFNAQRRKARLLNLATVIVAVLGGLFFFIAGLWQVQQAPFPLRIVARLVVTALALGLPLASLHFIRREMERLVVVDRLRSTLREVASGGAPTEVSPDDYEVIAGLERTHIIAERYQSVNRRHGGVPPSDVVLHDSYTWYEGLLGGPRTRVIDGVYDSFKWYDAVLGGRRTRVIDGSLGQYGTRDPFRVTAEQLHDSVGVLRGALNKAYEPPNVGDFEGRVTVERATKSVPPILSSDLRDPPEAA